MSAPYCNKNGKISINVLQSVEWDITDYPHGVSLLITEFASCNTIGVVFGPIHISCKVIINAIPIIYF